MHAEKVEELREEVVGGMVGEGEKSVTRTARP
jgi:hypothetical protein